MSEENLFETKRRSQRNSTLSFDVSRLSGQTLPKYRKRDKIGNMVNPPPLINPSILDMSQTISATSNPNCNTSNMLPNGNSTSSFHSSTPANDDINNVLREMVDANAQINLRQLVQECICMEMKKVYEAIGKLGDIVKNLNIGTNAPSNQPNNASFSFPNPPPIIEPNRHPEMQSE